MQSIFIGEFSDKLKEIVKNPQDDKSLEHCLFIPSVFQKYLDSSKRIMYCGIRSFNNFYFKLSELKPPKGPEDVDDVIRNVLLGTSYYQNGKDGTGPPFWNFIKQMQINPIELYWINLWKFSLNKLDPSPEFKLPCFYTIKQEIKLLKPNIVIMTYFEAE